MSEISLVDEALQSSQSFVRALKSSVDPPHDNGPSKIQIARLAWESHTLYVPHKAGLILEWILNRFHKEKSKICNENPLLDHNHWSLLADILEHPNDAQLEPITMRASIPALLADFITLYPSVPLNSRPAILTPLHRSLDVLWPLVMQRSTLDSLAECLWQSFAITDQLGGDIGSDSLVGLLTFVFIGFRAAFNNANAAGRKKVFNTITQYQLLPWLHSLCFIPPTHSLHSHFYDVGVEILFSPDSLRSILESHPKSKADREFYSTLFGSVTTSDSVARTSLLKLLPNLYRAYIVALRKHRSSVFPGANGAQNTRERIRLAAIRFEDECLGFPKRITDVELPETLCKATLDVLLVTEEEAIFNSTQQDDHTERLLRAGEDALKQLDRAWDESQCSVSTHALDTLSCLQRIEPELVLPLLPKILERLAISSPKLLFPALKLLNLLTSYHAKTRTLHILVTHTLSALASSFPLLLSSNVADVHSLFVGSPLLSLEFLDEFINTLRSFITPGQAKGVVKSVTEALQGCLSPHVHQTSQERPRKRRKLTTHEGTQMLHASRSRGSASDITKFVSIVHFGATVLGTILLNDACMEPLERRECLSNMDTWISTELQLGFPLDGGSSDVVNGREKRQGLGEQSELLGERAQQRFCAGVLRLWHELFAKNVMLWDRPEMGNDLRSLASLHRLHDLFQNCMRENLIPELHLEIGRVLYTNKAFFSGMLPQYDTPTWPAFDAVLDFLESVFTCAGDIPCPYSENHLTRFHSAVALWSLTLERHLSMIDVHASQAQLDRLVNLMFHIYSEKIYVGVDEMSLAGYILSRVLDSASFWEYSNLRTSMLSALDKHTLHAESIDVQEWLHAYINEDINTFYSLAKLRPSLRDIVDKAAAAFNLLHHFPSEYFTKNLKVNLIARALSLDVLLTACDPDAIQLRAICRSFVVMITKKTQIKYLEDLVASRPDWIIYLTLFKCGSTQPTQLYTCATLDLLSLIQNLAARTANKTKSGLLLNIIAQFMKCNPYLSENVGEPITHQSLLQFINMLTREFNVSGFEESVLTLLRQLCVSLESALGPAINTAIDQTSTTNFVVSERFISAWRALLSLKRWLCIEPSAKQLGETLLQKTAHIINSGSLEAHLVSNEFRVTIISLLITEMQASPETECRLVMSIIAAYVLFTASTDRHDTIYDNSMAEASKSFSLTQYQCALELVAEALEDGPNGESQLTSLMHLSALFLRVAPPGTSKVSHEHASQCFRMFINRPLFVKCSSALAMQALDFVQYQCTERAASLRPLDVACILSFLSKLLAGCSEHDEHTSPSIFESIVYVTSALVRLRRDLLGRYLPHLSMILRQMISAIRGVRPLLGHKQHRIVADKLPKWINPAESLGDAEARALARLLTSITTKSPVRTYNGDEQTAASLARPFARHAPYVLLAYLQLLNDPLGVFSLGIRRELKPGLFTLCTMMGEHGRDTLMVQSLDVGGKALLKSLWQEYEKQRYVGKG